MFFNGGREGLRVVFLIGEGRVRGWCFLIGGGGGVRGWCFLIGEVVKGWCF